MTTEDFKSNNGYEIQGMWMPRVTSIINVIMKPGLFYYYANHKNFATAKAALNGAANWGTLIHNSIEAVLRNEGEKIDKKVLPTISAFERWRGEHRTKILDSESDIEKQVCDFDNHYAGTLDVLMEIDGDLGVLDLKSGSSIWNEHFLQLAAYMGAYNKNAPAKRKAKKRWILRLDQYEECKICGAKRRHKTGEYRITGGDRHCAHNFSKEKGIFEFKELPDYAYDLDGFLNAKNLWEWVNKNSLKRIRNYSKNKKTLKLF